MEPVDDIRLSFACLRKGEILTSTAYVKGSITDLGLGLCTIYCRKWVTSESKKNWDVKVYRTNIEYLSILNDSEPNLPVLIGLIAYSIH